MAGLIERNAKLDITISQITGEIVDGQHVYRTIHAKAMHLQDFGRAEFDQFGTIRNGKVILVAPLSRAPEPPGQICCEGRSYDIQQVQELRNLKGVVQGYRIAVSGAE